MKNLPGNHQRDSATYAVANLSSLFTVCALALGNVEGWTDEIRIRVTQEVKHVLELGAALAENACLMVEELEDTE